LLIEASESDVQEALDGIAGAVAKEDGSHAEEVKKLRTYRTEFMTETFHDVMVQFSALGLIARSERRHPVNDSNIYWTLTPAGNAKLVELRAARKPAEEIAAMGASPEADAGRPDAAPAVDALDAEADPD
jgi:hypothetical protein